jgi:spermidine/putrescine transport system permease protein
MKHRSRQIEWLLTAPTFLWLCVFFLLPTLVIMVMTFKPASIYGGIGEGWTLDTLWGLAQPNYPEIIWRTIWLSLLTTVICLVLAVPVSYWLATIPVRKRNLMLLLVILPFWTNFLIRIFAWKTILHPEGWFKQTLVWVGLVKPETSLLYNEWAILLVLVYTYLPFAILPIFAAAEKFDFNLLFAAADLGANRLKAFWRIFLPGIRVGLITAVLVVFIPALGSYAIPDIVGGPDTEMIGNKIAQRTFADRNLPHASGLSSILAVIVLAPVVIYQIRSGVFSRKRRQGGLG